jgi:hypothetical protein
MDDILNGQIIPALGQWQGAILIVASLAAASLLGRAWRRRASITHIAERPSD